MTEEKKHSWPLRWVIFVLRSPIISLLTAAVVYYAVQAFVVNDSSFLYKLKLFAAFFLWMLWLISKYLLKIFVFLVLIGTAALRILSFFQPGSRRLRRKRPRLEPGEKNLRRKKQLVAENSVFY